MLAQPVSWIIAESVAALVLTLVFLVTPPLLIRVTAKKHIRRDLQVALEGATANAIAGALRVGNLTAGNEHTTCISVPQTIFATAGPNLTHLEVINSDAMSAIPFDSDYVLRVSPPVQMDDIPDFLKAVRKVSGASAGEEGSFVTTSGCRSLQAIVNLIQVVVPPELCLPRLPRRCCGKNPTVTYDSTSSGEVFKSEHANIDSAALVARSIKLASEVLSSAFTPVGSVQSFIHLAPTTIRFRTSQLPVGETTVVALPVGGQPLEHPVVVRQDISMNPRAAANFLVHIRDSVYAVDCFWWDCKLPAA